MKCFRSCTFEISGNCNAKCPYCITGTKNSLNEQRINEKGFISVELFEAALKKLFDTGIIDHTTCFNLYNWGEPLLHPDLHEIIACLCRFDLIYGLSTNASKRVIIDEKFTANLGSITFSMPGFSQSSYDRIHGFNFVKIKENIASMVQDLRAAGFQKDIFIDYHIYQFNMHEISACAQFAQELGISFMPYFAFFNDWWQMQGWLNNTLTKEKFKKVSEDLFCFYIKDNLKNMPPNYRCPQFDMLVIDENANVLTCCCLPKDHANYSIGNVLSDEISSILEKKEKQPICAQCLEAGLTHHFHNPQVPDCLIQIK